MGRRPGIDGRELLLAAALKLFSEHGIEGVSIRAVNREAGLGPASVHYHFGTKEALLDAVIRAYGDSVIQATKARAQEIMAAEGPATARDLVTMLAEPYLDLMADRGREGAAWVRVISSLLQSDPERIIDRSAARLGWSCCGQRLPGGSAGDGSASHADVLHAAGYPTCPRKTQRPQAEQLGLRASDRLPDCGPGRRTSTLPLRPGRLAEHAPPRQVSSPVVHRTLGRGPAPGNARTRGSLAPEPGRPNARRPSRPSAPTRSRCGSRRSPATPPVMPWGPEERCSSWPSGCPEG